MMIIAIYNHEEGTGKGSLTVSVAKANAVFSGVALKDQTDAAGVRRKRIKALFKELCVIDDEVIEHNEQAEFVAVKKAKERLAKTIRSIPDDGLDAAIRLAQNVFSYDDYSTVYALKTAGRHRKLQYLLTAARETDDELVGRFAKALSVTLAKAPELNPPTEGSE